MRLLTPRLRELVACDFIIGVDPLFAGITPHYAEGANDLRTTAHCLYDIHQLHRPLADRGPKVVLPSNPNYHWESWNGPAVVIHELGHVLQSRTEWDHKAEPVSEYAKTNHWEAFAEAFEAWIWGKRVDDATTALFNRAAY